LATTAVSCGKDINSLQIPPPAYPINTAQQTGLLTPVDPQSNQNVGPIDGEWNRKGSDTNCAAGSSPKTRSDGNPTISAYSYYFDNESGFVVINYYSGMELSIPVAISYPISGKLSLSRGTGNAVCKILTEDGSQSSDQGNCKSGSFREPNVATEISYVLASDKQSAVFTISNDSICVLNNSSTTSSSTSNVKLTH
jgi:hypothetical protein